MKFKTLDNMSSLKKLKKDLRFFFFSIITLYTKNVKQIRNTINSAPITIYVAEGKLNVKKEKKKEEKN